VKTYYLGNLSYSTEEDEIVELFAGYGTIESARIIRDRETGKSKGFAFLDISDERDSDQASEEIDGIELNGRSLRVTEARRGAGKATAETEQLVQIDLDQEIVQVTGQVTARLLKHFRDHPLDLKTINRRLFEEMVAEIWYGFGYDVELTGQSRDGGKDIIAVKRQIVEQKYLIECKRPDPGNKVGVKPVRELYAVKVSEMATKAILATTAEFTRDANILFQRHRWELEGKDFDGLMDWIRLYLSLKGA